MANDDVIASPVIRLRAESASLKADLDKAKAEVKNATNEMARDAAKALVEGLEKKLAGVGSALSKAQKVAAKEAKAIQNELDRLNATKATASMALLEKAVEKAGGTAKLSGSQIEILTRQIERLNAAGAKTPKTLVIPKVQQGGGIQAGLGAGLQSATGGLATGGALGAGLSAIGPAGLVAAAGLGAFTVAVRAAGEAYSDLIKRGSAIVDLAAKTQLSTNSLQKLQYAGSLVGVSLDEIAQGSLTLQRNLVNSPEIFERFGLSAKKLRELAPEDQLAAIAEKAQQIHNPTEQAAFLMTVLGKSGAALLPLLRSNLAEVTAEAERLGLVLDQQTLESLDKMDDSLTKLAAVTSAFKGNLVAAATGAVDGASAVDSFANAIGGLARALQSPIVKGSVGALFLAGVRGISGGSSGVITGAVGDVTQGLLGEVDRLTQAAVEIALKVQTKLPEAKDSRDSAIFQPPAQPRPDAEQAVRDADFLDQMAEKRKRAAEEQARLAKQAAEERKRQGLAELESQNRIDAMTRGFESMNENAGMVVTTVRDIGKETAIVTNHQVDAVTAARQQVIETVASQKAEEGRRRILEDVVAEMVQAGKLTKEQAAGVLDIKKATHDWSTELNQVADIFADLGQNGLAGMISGLAQSIGLAKQLGDELKKTGKLSGSSKIAIGQEAVSIGLDAYRGADTNTGKSTAKGALSGAGRGAAIGTAILPGYGTAIGAVVGGVIGGVSAYFGSKKKIKELLKTFDDQLIGQFGSLAKARQEADKYGIALGKALDSKKPKEIAAAMEKLNKELQKRANLEAGLANAQNSVESLQDLTKGSANTALTAAVQALAQKVSDELGKAGLGFAATGPLRDSEAFKQQQSISEATAGTIGGLRQAGVVDQGVLAAASTIAQESQKAAFDAAKAAGLDDAAATKASIGAISPLLREQLSASIASGRALDAKTQQLIDQAKANGIDILADPAIEAVAVQKDILAAIKGQGGTDGSGRIEGSKDDYVRGRSLSAASGLLGFTGSSSPRLNLQLHPNEMIRVTPGISTASLAGGTSTNPRGGGAPASVTYAPSININATHMSTDQIANAVAHELRKGHSEMCWSLDRKYRR